MANSMLATSYMTTLLDQAKTRYTITDKSTGEVLGFAFMLEDAKVTPDQVQLLPWHAHGIYDGKEEVHQQPPNRGVDECTLTAESLASDLDISEDSTINITAEATIASSCGSVHVKVNDDDMKIDFNANITQSSPGTEPAVDDHKSKVPRSIISSNLLSKTPTGLLTAPTLQSLTQSFAAQIVAQLKREVSMNETNEGVVHKNEVQMAGESITDSENLDELGKVAVSKKRKSEDGMEPPSKSAQFGPGKYTSFYTYAGVDQPENRKLKRVRCLLCPGEKTLAFGNFGEHVKGSHMPPVKCTVCGVEYSGATIKRHRKICIPKSNRKSMECNKGKEDVEDVHTADSPETPTIATLWPVFLPSQLGAAAETCNSSEASVNGSTTKFDGLIEERDTTSVCLPGCEGLSEGKVKSTDRDKVTFIMTSATVEGVRVKIGLKKGAKIKKAMKKYGKKFNISRKALQFKLCGEQLSGEELVGDLEGRDIVVVGKLN